MRLNHIFKISIIQNQIMYTDYIKITACINLFLHRLMQSDKEGGCTMKKRGHSCIAALLIFLAILTACNDSEKQLYTDDPSDQSPIVIYLFRRADWEIIDFVKLYNRTNCSDELDIEMKIFNDLPVEQMKLMYDELLNEMAIGEGPDIIAVKHETEKYMNISKLSEQNVFADFNVLIQRDASFDINEYNSVVMDAGVINSKRILMPVSYATKYLVGSKDNMEVNNLNWDKLTSIEQYTQIYEAYYSNNPGFPGMMRSIHVSLLREFLNSEGQFDDTELLRRYFRIAKNEYNLNLEHESGSAHPNEYQKIFTEQNLLFHRPWDFGANQFMQIHESYNYIEGLYGEAFFYVDVPTYTGETTKGYIDMGFLLNMNSKKKEQAYDFVKFMLNSSTQHDASRLNLPVHKEVFESEAVRFLEGYENTILSTGYMGDYEEDQVPEAIRMSYLESLESISECIYMGDFRYIYENVLQQSVQDYYDDRMSYREMLDEINNKLSIYYTE